MPRLQIHRRLAAVLASSLMVVSGLALAAPDDAAVKVLEDYLEFVDYGGATIFPEQIPAPDWKRFFVIDARDRAERKQIPRDKPVLLYCNTGTLSAQAGFALRVAGYENVRILQGGYAEWKAKGGFEANARAAGQSPRH